MAESKPQQARINPLPYSLGAWLARMVSMALIALIALCLLPFALQYVKDTKPYPYLEKLRNFQARMMESAGGTLRQYIPTKYGDADRTLWILVGGLFLLNIVAGRFAHSLKSRADYLRLKNSVEDWENKMGLDKNSAMATELNSKLTSLQPGKKKDREELLKIFADAKRKLSGMGRELAFLSIDVVGSTGMKVGEDQESIEHDFKQYKIFVDTIFQASGMIKATWTPDGVMACFSNIDTAVKAGKDVIRGLEHFNRQTKLMKTDFVVRCGVNAGFVYMDDNVPLEEVSDRVIDIAGHMQKHAEPNTVAVAKTVVEPMTNRQGFQETKKVVDGYQVYHWRAGDPD